MIHILALTAALAAPPGDSAAVPPSLPALEVTHTLRAFAEEGIPVDGVRRSLLLLVSRFLERYPQLAPLLRDLGVNLADPLRFARSVLAALERTDLSVIGFDTGEEREDAMALVASWLRRGRVPLDELSFRVLTAGERWRRLPRPDPSDLRWYAERAELLARTRRRPRRGEAHGDAERDGERSRERASEEETHGWLPRLDLRPTPEAVSPFAIALASVLAVDFLAHYERSPEPVPPASGAEMLALFARASFLAAPPALRSDATRAPPPSFGEREVDPRLERGIGRLFADLTRELAGIDLALLDALRETLPAASGSVLALGGYEVTSGELLGLPLHRLATGYLELHLGSRMRIEWLESREQLEELLLDPTVERLFMVGHASWGGFGFRGLTGKPERTVARLLTWLGTAAAELAPRVRTLLVESDPRPLAAYLPQALGIEPQHLAYREFAALAQRERFQRKRELVVYACGVEEIIVEPSDARAFRRALSEAVAGHPDAGRWLDLTSDGKRFFFHPIVPAADAMFREGLAPLLADVRRHGESFRVEAAENFATLLATESSRFPGQSWVHDFVREPEGRRWDPGELVERVRAALAAADGESR